MKIQYSFAIDDMENYKKSFKYEYVLNSEDVYADLIYYICECLGRDPVDKKTVELIKDLIDYDIIDSYTLTDSEDFYNYEYENYYDTAFDIAKSRSEEPLFER